MIFMMVFLGILTILAGIIPLLASFKITLIPLFLSTGWGYAAIVTVIGLIGLGYALNPMAMGVMGTSKFLLGALGLVTILGGILPLVAKFFKFIPASLIVNPVYAIIIIVIGLVGLGYGASQMM